MNKADKFEQIQFEIENQVISGKITFYNTRDLTVEITSPYQNTTNHFYTTHFLANDLIEKFGGVEAVAKRLLTEIYENYEFAKTNRTMLLEKIQLTEAEIELLNQLISQFRQEKTALKKRLRTGEITNIEYQKLLKPIKFNIQNANSKIYDCWHEYFKLFPKSVPYNMRMNIIDLIKN